jgi:stage V sporulation protein D (sporulation-specific penicillin-binding protein)
MRVGSPGFAVRRRVLACLCSVATALGLLAVRLGWLQVVRGSALYSRALDVRTRVVPVPARRGLILDAQGHVLAISVGTESVYATPAQVQDPIATAAALSRVLAMPSEVLAKRLRRHLMFVWLRRRVSDAQAAAVRRLRLPGVHLVQESRRLYPRGMFAAQVLGFVGIDNQGLAGVELSYNRELRGRPGAIVIEADATNRDLPFGRQRFVPPVEGDTLQLTLSGPLQDIVQRDLDAAVARAHALAGYALMMNPRNGAILAMASWPTFDPNHYADAAPRLWTNPILTYAFSPGSVFKPITAAAALQSGVVTPESPFFDSGSLRVPGATIHNHNRQGLGQTTFRQGFIRSANTIFARVGILLGVPRFYQYLGAFGFTGRTGIDLPGEARRPNILTPEARATPLDIAEEAFGQTLAVTPISMLTAIAAIANGGELVRPHVGAALLAPDGRLLRRIDPPPLRRVLSPGVAYQVQDLMAGVVAEGTGRQAQIPCYAIAGKTGTTQKYVGGRVAQGVYIASFLGYAPAHGARVALYVMIDEPQGVYYGGQVAAPVFRSIMLDALRVLGVPADCAPGGPTLPGLGAPDQQVAMPALLGLPAAEAERLAAAAGLFLRVEGGAGRIVRQVPPAGTRVQRWSTVLGYTRPATDVPGETVAVPDLRGQTLAGASDALAALGLQLEARGTGVVVEQSPPPGVALHVGDVVAVRLGGAG